MKADMDEGLAKKMSRPLPTEVMTRPGSKKPLPPMAKRQREKRYSFGALEKDKNLTLEEYRRKAGRDPMGYKERKVKEVFAALDAASGASVPKLVGSGLRSLGSLATARFVAGEGAKQLLKKTAKESGKKTVRQGTEKYAEGKAKDLARPEETPAPMAAGFFPVGQKPKPDVVFRPPMGGMSDRLTGRLKGKPKPRVNRTAQEIAAKKRRAQGDAETKAAMDDFSAAVKRRDEGMKLVKRPSNYTTTGGKISPVAGRYEAVRKPSA